MYRARIGLRQSALWGLVLTFLLVAGGCPGEIPKKHGNTDGATRFDVGLVIYLDLGAYLDGKPDDAVVPPPDTVSVHDDSAAMPADTGTPDRGPTPDAWVGSDDIGKPCTSNAQCIHKLCAMNTHTGVRFCTKVCNACTASPCPSSSGCQNAGLAYICAPGYPNASCNTP